MAVLSYVNLIDPILRNFRSSIPTICEMHKGQKVLDVCCGTGAQVFEYAKFGLNASGIDIDPGMLAMSSRYAKQIDSDNFTLVMGDAEHMPFSTATFDFVSISLAIHDKNREQQDAIISEMKRVAKGNGKLVFLDYSYPLPNTLSGLAIRGIELLAGGDHSRNFRRYSQGHGLKTVLMRSALNPISTFKNSNGLLAVMLCPKA